MHILHIYDHTEPHHSGYVYRSRSLRQALERSGHHCDVLSMPRHYTDFDYKSSDDDTEIINNQSYYRSPPTQTRIPILRELTDIYSAYKRIKSCITSKDYDILHIHSPVLGVFSALFARYFSGKKKLKIVYEIRAFWEDAAVDHGTLTENSLKYRAIRFLETLGCSLVDHVYPICHPLKNDLIKRGIKANKITVIQNVLTENAFNPSPTDNTLNAHYNIQKTDYVLGFIGSFYYYEGLEDLIPIMKFFKDHNHPVKLLLVGGGIAHDKIKEKITELSLQDYIILTGRVPHNTVSSYYNLCHCMIYPRRSMRLTETVTPLKPLEAAAAKVPVILSNIGGHKALLADHETGFFIDDFTNIELASEKILGFLHNKKLRNLIAKQAYDYVLQERIADVIAKKYYKFSKTFH